MHFSRVLLMKMPTRAVIFIVLIAVNAYGSNCRSRQTAGEGDCATTRQGDDVMICSKAKGGKYLSQEIKQLQNTDV